MEIVPALEHTENARILAEEFKAAWSQLTELLDLTQERFRRIQVRADSDYLTAKNREFFRARARSHRMAIYIAQGLAFYPDGEIERLLKNPQDVVAMASRAVGPEESSVLQFMPSA